MAKVAFCLLSLLRLFCLFNVFQREALAATATIPLLRRLPALLTGWGSTNVVCAACYHEPVRTCQFHIWRSKEVPRHHNSVSGSLNLRCQISCPPQRSWCWTRSPDRGPRKSCPQPSGRDWGRRREAKSCAITSQRASGRQAWCCKHL